MIVSQARIEANKRNALKSRGPSTEAGKAKSRANALTHGLSATVVKLDDENALVEKRKAEWAAESGNPGGFNGWIIEQVAAISVKIDRAERVERETRSRIAIRAGVSWDDDRRIEAEVVARNLAEAPGETVERLKSTPRGCDWLISRWAMLATAEFDWGPDQKDLALDLLGVPREFRERLDPGKRIDTEGTVVEYLRDRPQTARDEIAALKARRDDLEELDDLDRAIAQSDLLDESHPEIRRIRRHQSNLHRQLRFYLAQIQPTQPGAAATPSPQPPTRALPPEPPPALPRPAPALKVEPAAPSRPALPRPAARLARIEARRIESTRRDRERRLA